MKNTTYKENVLSLIQLFHFHKKGYFFLYVEKNAFYLKRGVLLALKISDFGWKGLFLVVFSSKIREKGVFFKLGYERGIRFGREGRG